MHLTLAAAEQSTKHRLKSFNVQLHNATSPNIYLHSHIHEKHPSHAYCIHANLKDSQTSCSLCRICFGGEASMVQLCSTTIAYNSIVNASLGSACTVYECGLCNGTATFWNARNVSLYERFGDAVTVPQSNVRFVHTIP